MVNANKDLNPIPVLCMLLRETNNMLFFKNPFIFAPLLAVRL